MEITVVVASFIFLFWKKPNFYFLLFFAKGPGPVTPVRWSFRQPTTAETRRNEQVIFLYNRSTPMSTVALYKKKTRIDHFEINWKWHSIINWQNLEKRKRRKIWRLIEAGGHVSARLGSTQSEQTPMISSSQEWEKPDWEEEEEEEPTWLADRLGVLYGIILEVLCRDYCHAAAAQQREKKKENGNLTRRWVVKANQEKVNYTPPRKTIQPAIRRLISSSYQIFLLLYLIYSIAGPKEAFHLLLRPSYIYIPDALEEQEEQPVIYPMRQQTFSSSAQQLNFKHTKVLAYLPFLIHTRNDES